MNPTPKELVDSVLVDGNADALSIYDALRGMQADLEYQTNRLKSAAMAELAKHGKEGLKLGQTHYGIRATGGRWKYDHIPEWKEVNEKQKEIEERAKAAYKALESGISGMADTDGVEVLPAHYTPGAETIFATPAK